MKYIKELTFILSTIILVACQSGKSAENKIVGKEQPKRVLANGFYAVLGESDTEEKARAFKSERVLKYEYKYHQYEEGEIRDAPVYLALNSAPEVPLTLAKSPQTEKDKKGSPFLQLQLNEKAAKELEDFTGGHLGKAVAIVVDGEVISKHKVKAAIKGGKIQITWCSANACETLSLKLKAP